MGENQKFVLKTLDGIMATIGYMNTYGKRQRLLRNDLGLTQAQLAEQITKRGVEIGQGYISELERTDKIPLGDIVAATAKVLRTSADFLLQLTDDHTPRSGNEDDSFISEKAGEAAGIIDDLDDDSREIILYCLRWIQLRDRERRDLHQEITALLVSGINQFDENQRKGAQAILAKLRRPHPTDSSDTHHT